VDSRPSAKVKGVMTQRSREMPAPWGALGVHLLARTPARQYTYRSHSNELTMTTLSSHRGFLADKLSRQSARRNLVAPDYPYTAQPVIRGHSQAPNAEAGPSKRNIPNYIPEEETIRNDLTERYIQTGEFGSNYIQGAEEKEICEE